MVITLPPELESAVTEQARRRGVDPVDLVMDLLEQRLTRAAPPAADEWERRLFGAAVDCGVSVPDEALSSDGLYE